MSTLELFAVRKHYGSVSAVDGVSLHVETGTRTAIVGSSGCGKTTLLRLIAGFEAPDAGGIVLDGQVLARGPTFVPAHKRVIGFVPQDGALFPHLSVEGNVGFGLAGAPRERARRIAELMDSVALDAGLLERWPHELSGGQQQRVALARALAQRPKLMLLDEPFSALDAGLRSATRKAVAQSLAAAGVTTILVTHDQAEALSFADQLAVMRNGRLVQAGRPMDVYSRPIDEATALFLGEGIVLPASVEDGWANCALGRIPVDASSYGGAARVLLRPEQLRLVEIDASAGASGAYVGIVSDVDFDGHGALITVGPSTESTASDGSFPRALLVRSVSNPLPAVGTAVRIAVTGRAHILSS